MANVMCSFNKLNGVYACENNDLLSRILRTQLGFDGFVITDFGASHSTVGSINAGLNLEAGFTTFYDGALLAAVQAGQVSVSLVNQRVQEILRAMFRVGLFDNPLPTTPQPIPVEEHGGIARETENQAVTLLKNSNAALPVSRQGVDSIAVIGADANRLAQQSGAPAVGTPTYRMPLLEGLRQRAGSGVSVDWAPGGDGVGPSSMLPGPPAVPSAVLEPAGAPGQLGLRAEYFDNLQLQGTPIAGQHRQPGAVRPRVADELQRGDGPAAAAVERPVGPVHRHLHGAGER